MYRPDQPPNYGARGGSVKRARERAAAGLPPEMNPPPLPSQIPRSQPQGNTSRPRQPMPPALSASVKNQTPIGIAISRPTPAPQWPLPANPNIPQFPDNTPQPAGRGRAPQRPPRPSNVPSMLDASRVQGPIPMVYAQNTLSPVSTYSNEHDSTIMAGTPLTASSRPSTVSSVGSIPDFPMPMPPRRSANLGPPPSSRRGASSYYSTSSFVSPIPEESPRALPSHESYASSAAIPSSWGDESPRFYIDDTGFSEDEQIPSPREAEREIESRETESRESSRYDDSDERQLVRQASVGRRGRPSVVTTKSQDKADSSKRPGPAPLPISMNKLAKMGVFGSDEMRAARAAPGPGVKVNEDIARDMLSPLASGTGFIDSTSSSEETITRVDPKSDNRTGSPATAFRVSPMPNSQSSTSPSPVSQEKGPSRLSSFRRPPRLDIDAVRANEQRGSLTSLPDLIRRATRLAAMMENGKRPASRLNVFSGFFGGDDGSRERDIDDEKHASRLSDMLAAFPPPGLATPTRDAVTPQEQQRPISAWPGPMQYSRNDSLDNVEKTQKPKRRCCGLPCWGFLLLLLVILVIIAAAVVIPIELLVVHKSTATTTATVLSDCQSELTCENGGTNVITSGECTCLCVNGFSGTTCSNSGSQGCTTMDVNANSSDVSNVTIGEAIPRLIDESDSNFSIPLDSSVVISRFNAANLSCTSENALVTFNGKDERDLEAYIWARLAGSKMEARSTAVVDVTTGTTVPTSIIVASSIYAGSATTTSSASATATFEVTDDVLDFARVAVLYVLQEDSLDDAVTAQSSLQRVITAGLTESSATNVSIGNGNTVNLVDMSIDIGNGTVGGTGGSD